MATTPKIDRWRADREAARLRAALTNRRARGDHETADRLAATYERDGYGTDGYPHGYPDDDKKLG